MGEKRTTLTDERREELMASITTYRFVDGREVDRRHAYPFVSMKVNMRSATKAFQNFRESLQDKIFGGLFEAIAYEPHESVTLRRVPPDRRASAGTACPTPTMPPALRGTAGLE